MIRFKEKGEVLPLIYGSAFYGGGGGGSINDGIEVVDMALRFKGEFIVLEPDEVDDESVIVTVSAVGAPAAKEKYLKPYQVVRAVELLLNAGVEVDGLIPPEVGALNSVFGWVASSVLDIPVVDMPCDGRAHPTGVMGSMGLHRHSSYISIQAVAGGDPARNKYVEALVKSSLEISSRLVRRVSEEAGGLVAVARNPVTADFVKKHGAPNALKKAIEVGEVIVKESRENPVEAGYKAFEKAGGEVLGKCLLKDVVLETRGGFDLGKAKLVCDGSETLITFFNEYMTLDVRSGRVATFPDLIVTIDLNTGIPITSAELPHYLNKEVLVGYVNRKKVILGDGLKYEEVYRDLEENLNIRLIDYIRDILY